MSNELDQIIARLQNVPGWNVWRVGADGSIEPWYDVTGGIVNDLVIQDGNLQEQVQSISAQIMHWGRLTAQCKRVWEITERLYRTWRDGKSLGFLIPPIDPVTNDYAKDWKKPSIAQMDQMIRTDPEYAKHYEAQERAEEAYNASLVVKEGFKAKKDMMQAAITRRYENAAPKLDI